MRPIDADALLMRLPDDLPYKASVKRVLLQAPSLDVVPREEVDHLRHMLDSYALQYGTVKDQHAVIDRIKAETAREIFEEIESKKMFVRDRIGNMRAVVLFEDIAELKKKYTEDSTDGKRQDR